MVQDAFEFMPKKTKQTNKTKQKLHVHACTSDKPVSIYQDPLHKHKTLYKPIHKPNQEDMITGDNCKGEIIL